MKLLQSNLFLIILFFSCTRIWRIHAFHLQQSVLNSLTTTPCLLSGPNDVMTHKMYHRSHAINLNMIPRGGQTVAPTTATPTMSDSVRKSSSLQSSNLPNVAPTFHNAPFLQSMSIFAGVNALGFIISLATGSHLHLDLLGTGAFALASLPALLFTTATTTATSVPSRRRVFLSTAAVCTWSVKLAGFLFFRASQVKTDGRLDDTLSTVSGTFGFWLISFLWGVICSLPHTLGTTSSKQGNRITLVVGGILYVLGLVTESLADYQKWMFKNQHPGKFCNEGLWSVSQHPNFFGNLLLWSGIFIMNSDSLIGQNVNVNVAGGKGGILSWLWRAKRLFVAMLSPCFMWMLFSGQANGSITNAVELAHQKYGNDPAFQEYIQGVPQIIPNLASWLKQLSFRKR